jgi:radical SAM protein with 4Fe4S-binding SPASM domain
MREALLRPDEVRALYEDLLSVSLPGLEVVTGDPLASQMRQPEPLQPSCDASGNCAASGGCAAGVSGITILADGTLTPCRRLPLPIGNILVDSFREIWSESEVLNLLRDKSSYTGNCGRCARWSSCRGCRAIAYAWQPEKRSSFLADDPQCFCYQPQ